MKQQTVACVLDHSHHIREVRGAPPEVTLRVLGRHFMEAVAEADRCRLWHQLQRLSLWDPPVEIVVRSVFGRPWRALAMQLTETRVVVVGTVDLSSHRQASPLARNVR